MDIKRVNILGTEYEIVEQSEKENLKLKNANGLCEYYARKIIIDNGESWENDPIVFENIEEYKKKVIRHEIFHAFFGESGLRNNSDFGENEELVDWLAIQSPKIFKVFQELGIM